MSRSCAEVAWVVALYAVSSPALDPLWASASRSAWALDLSGLALLAGTVLAFARALGEFGATILVAGNIPGRTQTLATALYQRVQAGDDAGALRLAGLAAALAFAALLAVEILQRRRERRLER